MSLFHVDDYPEWIEELAESFGVENEVTDQGIWDLAREAKEYPHLGNIVASELLSLIKREIDEICRDLGIVVDIKYEANAMGSYLAIDGTDYTDGDAINAYLQDLS